MAMNAPKYQHQAELGHSCHKHAVDRFPGSAFFSTPLTITKDVDGLVCHIITSSLHLMCSQF
jgi:hypothetical protein